MKICVTGGAGYIGSHTCKALALAGHEVLVYDNLSTGHRDFVKWGEFVWGDIRDSSRLEDALRRFRPDGVIHFAASAYVGESVIDPGKYFSNNVGGTLSLLEAMRRAGVGAIVVSGTCAIYGQPSILPITEDCPKNPINPYGASKLFMERMLGDFETAHSLRWTSLRYFNAAGSSPDGEIGERHDPETHLIPRVIWAGLGLLDVIEVFGHDYATPDGTCIRDYIHVDDLAAAHILAIERLLGGGDSVAMNLGTGAGSSVNQIIGGVQELLGRQVPVAYGPRRAGDPAALLADATLARELLGWVPLRNLSVILEDALRFFTR